MLLILGDMTEGDREQQEATETNLYYFEILRFHRQI